MQTDKEQVESEFASPTGFLQKALPAISWNAANLVLGFPVKLGLSLVLMRFLEPQLYGTIAIPLVVVAICDTIVRCGFQNSLIHHNEPDSRHYASIMMVNLSIASLLYALIFSASIAYEQIYPLSNAGYALRWLGIALVIRAAFLVQIADANIRLNFKKQSLIEFSSYLLAYALAIGLAAQGFGLSSLIAFYVATPVIALTCYWFSTTWIPKLSEIRFRVIAAHWPYAKHILGQEIVDTFTNRVDLVIIGSVVSPGGLGLFSKAKDYSELLTTSSSKLISRPAFALFARIKNDPARHRQYFLKCLGLIASLYAVLIAVVVINCQAVIGWILPRQWEGVGLLLQILALASLFCVPSTFSRYILLSKGGARIHLLLTICKSLLRITGLVAITACFLDSGGLLLRVAVWEVCVAVVEALLIGIFLRAQLGVSFRSLFIALSDAALFCVAIGGLLVTLITLHSTTSLAIANFGVLLSSLILARQIFRKNELLRDGLALGYRKLLKPQAL